MARSIKCKICNKTIIVVEPTDEETHIAFCTRTILNKDKFKL